ncbi:MAG TPA: FKBP-type peptidyl-prolyl cis-trans isomerase [Pirellulales bacterium]|jgi:FKBP-type peptidyl-prolyl cis-trans isomerase FklB|nr:FKBP-type peptidyl-prolyl cis-trans isomerase [Pirellulales bacterium]
MKRLSLLAPMMGTAATGMMIFVAGALAQQSRMEQIPANNGMQPGQGAKGAAQTPGAAGLSTSKQKASYCVGMMAGYDILNRQLTADDLDTHALLQGLTDALSEAKPALSEEEFQQVMTDLHSLLANRAKAMEDKVKAMAEKNKTEGDAFLAQNKTKQGVKALPSGLQYKVLQSGNGPTPGPNDMVSAHYKGTLLDGTLFDSSYDRGKPATFPVNGVIKGWTEALQLMKVGDKWQLFVPSELAYGERGRMPKIAPNSVLVFDVELLDVKKGDAAPGAVR